VKSPRAAVSIAFLVFGVTAGTVLPRLDTIKENLNLTDGQIGLAFLAFSVGAVVAAGVARLLLARGARKPVRIVVAFLCLQVVTPALAPSFSLLVAAFVLGGVGAGLSDVLLNAQAVELERKARRPMINGFHAYWSLGAIVGSVIAAGAAAVDVSPLVHFTVVGVALAVLSAPLVAAVPDTRGGAAVLVASGAGRWRLGFAVAVVAALAFLGIFVEGGGSNWSAIYLRDVGHAAQAVAALGFAGFTVAMTATRFNADRLTAMTGARVVAAIGGLVCALGFAVAVAFPEPVLAILGFALIGAGCAVMVPLAFSAGANLDEAGNALSMVTAAGYAGSIFGPPLIGAAADRFGLRLALVLPLVASVLVFGIMAATRVLSSRTTRRLADATESVESKA
jgi:MFS family permease